MSVSADDGTNVINRDTEGQLLAELTGSQNRLYGLILTLIPDRDRARDVLQETNLVIWRKVDEFTEGTNFWAWAARIAHYEVLAYYRDQARDRHVFDKALIDRLWVAASECSGDDPRRDALHACLGELNARHQEMVRARYRSRLSLEEISRDTGRSVAAVKMVMLRIRRALSQCIERRLAAEETV